MHLIGHVTGLRVPTLTAFAQMGLLPLVTALLAFSPLGHAEERLTLPAAVESAILSNPEVLQSYHTYEASVLDADAARGGYLPKVDLTASAGQESRHDPLLNKNYGRSQASLALRQMIFDGFGTRSEVDRLSKLSRSKLLDLESVSQKVALDATRAFLDLLRYRTLTTLAEDNYVAHKVIYEQLVLKANAGVGKKSDVEQAKSRLSLAEYNMNIEGSNLHDIEARYQRLIGALPPREITLSTTLSKDIPKELPEAISKSQVTNPSLKATMQDVLSQKALVENKDASFMPRVEFRARTDHGDDLNGVDGAHRTDVAEVVMTWNLFNGNADRNLKRKEQMLLQAAYDRREKACRDIRLELEIAYNDIRKLTEQVNYLDARQISIEKARDAYRKQFDIGQRSLVDLLNSENEVFEAKRLYTNASNDLNVAMARTHFQIGSLLTVLGLQRYASDTAPLPSDMQADTAFSTCPAEAPMPYVPDRSDLDARALELLVPIKSDTQSPEKARD